MIVLEKITLKKQLSALVACSVAMLLPLHVFATDFKLPEGTQVKLRLSEGISSKDAIEGQTVSFDVAEGVFASDEKTLLIKAGTLATGTITKIEKNGMMGKPGELGLTLDKTKAVDGSRVSLRASMGKEGNSKRGLAIGLGLVGSLVVLWPLAFFFMKKGKDAKIPAGSVLTSYVNTDTMISLGGAAQLADTSGETPQIDEAVNMVTVSKETPAYVRELEALDDLKNRGLITPAEFEAKKKQLLGL